MSKKPEVVETDPRLLAKGVVIWHRSNQSEEVVREVSVVLHLSNGESQTYRVGTDQVEVLKSQPIPVKKSELMSDRELSEVPPKPKPVEDDV